MTQRSLTDAHIVDSFTADAEFALQVDQGETFTVETRDRFEPLFRGEPLDRASVVALVGPVAIEGVRAGDVVEIEIVDIKSRTGFGYLLRNQTFGLFKTDIEERVEARLSPKQSPSSVASASPGSQFRWLAAARTRKSSQGR